MMSTDEHVPFDGAPQGECLACLASEDAVRHQGLEPRTRWFSATGPVTSLDTVYVTASDAATLRQIADEFGLDLATARRRLELDDTPDEYTDDEPLRPRVAAVYRHVLAAVPS